MAIETASRSAKELTAEGVRWQHAATERVVNREAALCRDSEQGSVPPRRTHTNPAAGAGFRAGKSGTRARSDGSGRASQCKNRRALLVSTL